VQSLELKLPPPLVTALTAIGMWFTADATAGLNRVHAMQNSLTVTLTLVGIAVAVYGVLCFRRARTTINPLKPAEASSLVITGVFHYSRNPMYLGMLCILMGWAIHLGNVLATSWLFIYVVYLTRFQIIPEERALLERFGDSYADYMKRVRRWI